MTQPKTTTLEERLKIAGGFAAAAKEAAAKGDEFTAAKNQALAKILASLARRVRPS